MTARRYALLVVVVLVLLGVPLAGAQLAPPELAVLGVILLACVVLWVFWGGRTADEAAESDAPSH